MDNRYRRKPCGGIYQLTIDKTIDIYNTKKLKKMSKILKFDVFSKSKPVMSEDHDEMMGTEGKERGENQHYMFFQNLETIQHCIDQIMAMDKEAIDNLIANGHDWASDHVATSKDDVEEVSNWLRSSLSGEEEEHEEEENEGGEATEIEMIDDVETEDDDEKEGEDETDEE